MPVEFYMRVMKSGLAVQRWVPACLGPQKHHESSASHLNLRTWPRGPRFGGDKQAPCPTCGASRTVLETTEADRERNSHERSHHGGLERKLGIALFNFLQYVPSEEKNIYARDNFGPVEEVGSKIPLEVISGEIPKNFPLGVYVRTGPNPAFGGKVYKSKLGISRHHWFEGDGMLHAVYFEKRGDKYEMYYRNKYVENEGYLVEKKERKPVILTTLEGDQLQVFANILLNQLRFGFLSKPTCNTNIWCHGGRVFAGAENHVPYEINMSDLATLGKFEPKGDWPYPNMSAHPKIDPVTEELIFQSYCVEKKPHILVGVISADGETLKHKIDVGGDRASLNHDIMITERYTVVMDFPVLLVPMNIMKGKPMLSFDRTCISKFAVVPRFGDSSSLRWFEVETSAMFHSVNAYDDGDEVVVHGLRSGSSFFNVDMNLNQGEWYRRGVTPVNAGSEGYDPSLDGALLSHLHEWRFNLKTGTVSERDIYDRTDYVMLEFPRVNDSYVGRKYRYGYASLLDLHQSRQAGQPYFKGVTKVDFSTLATEKGTVTMEHLDLGPNRYGGEPLFVANPEGQGEDDGWVVLFVYDESKGSSEVNIIDAKKFLEGPVARISLPQRVPFGFHGTFVPSRG